MSNSLFSVVITICLCIPLIGCAKSEPSPTNTIPTSSDLRNQQATASCQELPGESLWNSYTPDARKLFESLSNVDIDPDQSTYGHLTESLQEPPQGSEKGGDVTRLSWYGGAVTATFRTGESPATTDLPIEIAITWPFLGTLGGVRVGNCVESALDVGSRSSYGREKAQTSGDWVFIDWTPKWMAAIEATKRGSIRRLVVFDKHEPNWIPRSSPAPRSVGSQENPCDQLANPSAKLAIYAGLEVATSNSKDSAYASAPCGRWVVDIDVMSVPNPEWAPKFVVLGTVDPALVPNTLEDCQRFSQELRIFKRVDSTFIPVVTSTAVGEWTRDARGQYCKIISKPDGILAPEYVPPIALNTATEASGLRGLMFWLDRPQMSGDLYRNDSYRITLGASAAQTWKPVTLVIRYDTSWRK
jgi:hypothetical protein